MKKIYKSIFVSSVVALTSFACKTDIKQTNLDTMSTKRIFPTNVTTVARLTGATLSDEIHPNPNQTQNKWEVMGTDLGIFWRLGGDSVGIALGDSYGKGWKYGGSGGDNWRNNLIAVSSDTLLDDGITFDYMITDDNGVAKELIHSARDEQWKGDHTSIPTAAIRIGSTDYIHYMSVRGWGRPWANNYSGIAYSNDGCNTWTDVKNLFPSYSKFSQAAYWQYDNHIYMMGTIAGRFGGTSLSRFDPKDILNPIKYEYWNDEKGWMMSDEKEATTLFGDTESEVVGELSIVYHDYYKHWIAVYLNEYKEAIVMRSASNITGPWGDEEIITTSKEHPQLYGGFIYPLNLTQSKIYIALSMWQPYNVFLMRIDLEEKISQ